jgi:hypothetical protein
MLLRRAAAASGACCRLRRAASIDPSSLRATAVSHMQQQRGGIHTTLGKKKDYLPAAKESRKSLTKIVATIGPASEQFEPLQAVRLSKGHACV